MLVRVIPGLVTQSEHVALAVYPPDGSPDPEFIAVAEDGTQHSPSIQAGGGNAKVESELAAYAPPLKLVKLKLSGLRAGLRHEWLYRTPHHTRSCAHFRTMPASPAEVGLMVSSCYYDHLHAGAKLYASMAARRDIHLKLLVGDNLYLDVAPGQMSVWGGWEETRLRYARYFWESQDYASVLGLHANVTTWDDHEYWNNYPEEQPWLWRTFGGYYGQYKDAGTAYLDAFQNSLNSLMAKPASRNHVISTPAGEIFLADVRSERQVYSNVFSRMMPDVEFARLLHWLGNLKRPGILVLGQPLWLKSGDWRDYTPLNFGVQYAELWHALNSAPFDVLVVSGDVHHSRLCKINMGRDRFLHEFVCSPGAHIPTMKSMIGGGYGTEGKTGVSYPDDLKVPCQKDVDPDKRLKPKLDSVPISVGDKNSYGVLRLKRLPTGSLYVTASLHCPAATTASGQESLSYSFELKTRPKAKEPA